MTPLWGVAALIAPLAPAAEAPSLDAWHGRWVGEGEAFGKPATATLEIAPGKAGATTLGYRLAIAGTPPISYSAAAVYSLDAAGRWRGSWTDSHDRTRAVAGRITGAEWSVNWGSADVEIGRSIYRLQAPDLLVVSDSDGHWRVFATLRYRRNKP